MKTIEQLLDDLVNQAVLEYDLDQWSTEFVNLRAVLIGRYAQMERKAADDQRAQAGPMQAVRGEPDTPGALGSADLSDVRRVAAHPGTPNRATTPATGHHIMTSVSMLAVACDPDEDVGQFTTIWPARFHLWACGPHQAAGCGLTPDERDRQIADHCT